VQLLLSPMRHRAVRRRRHVCRGVRSGVVWTPC
jgi:hypothetical protein